MNKIPIYNPRTKDFSIKYDIDGTGNPKRFTIRAGEIQYFEPVIARHITRHLANKLLDERGYIDGAKGNAELSLESYKDEIRVNLDAD